MLAKCTGFSKFIMRIETRLFEVITVFAPWTCDCAVLVRLKIINQKETRFWILPFRRQHHQIQNFSIRTFSDMWRSDLHTAYVESSGVLCAPDLHHCDQLKKTLGSILGIRLILSMRKLLYLIILLKNLSCMIYIVVLPIKVKLSCWLDSKRFFADLLWLPRGSLYVGLHIVWSSFSLSWHDWWITIRQETHLIRGEDDEELCFDLLEHLYGGKKHDSVELHGTNRWPPLTA